jgi:hypothetical protein
VLAGVAGGRVRCVLARCGRDHYRAFYGLLLLQKRVRCWFCGANGERLLRSIPLPFTRRVRCRRLYYYVAWCIRYHIVTMVERLLTGCAYGLFGRLLAFGFGGVWFHNMHYNEPAFSLVDMVDGNSLDRTFAV